MFFNFSTLLMWIFSESQTVSGGHKLELSSFLGSWLFVTCREPLIDPKTCLERFLDTRRLFLINFGYVGHVCRCIWGVYTHLRFGADLVCMGGMWLIFNQAFLVLRTILKSPWGTSTTFYVTTTKVNQLIQLKPNPGAFGSSNAFIYQDLWA